MEGCDFVQEVTLSSPVTTSTVLYSLPINPLSLAPASRLASFAGLYDKYRFLSVSFHFATSVSTATDGSMMMSWDPDTQDNYSSITGSSLITQLTSTQSNVDFSVYRNANMLIPASKDLFVQLETGGDPRIVNHGRLWVAAVGGLPAGTYGRILMKWRIKFSKPNIDPDVVSVNYAASHATTSSSISTTYPWGQVGASGSVLSPTYNASRVAFLNTIPGSATAASVVQFNVAGKYRVCITITGTALGTGSFTPTSTAGVTITGTGGSAPAYPFAGTAAVVTVSAGDTQVQGWIDVMVNSVGGYIACTGGGGTHNTGYLTVISFPPYNVPPPPQMSLELRLAQMENQLKTLAVAAAPGAFDFSAITSTVPSPANEPVKQSKTLATGSVGTLDVVVLDPPPAPSPQASAAEAVSPNTSQTVGVDRRAETDHALDELASKLERIFVDLSKMVSNLDLPANRSSRDLANRE